MSIIELAAAKEHLRLEQDYPDDQVETYLLAAELRAAQFLNRALFVDDAAMAASVAAVPARLAAAEAEFNAAKEAAAQITEPGALELHAEAASSAYAAHLVAARETMAGIVATDDIKAAILLILGHLFENRADVEANATTAIPNGSEYLLMPYRIGWGG